jgi:UDP:flavonoid glycosyltransferase YjiC (YdhE family)
VITKTRLHAWLSTIGSAGDVNPFIAIGRELVRRGHRATLVTSSFFEAQARSAGLDYVGLGSAEDYRRTVDDPELWDPKTGFRVFAQRVVIRHPAGLRPSFRERGRHVLLARADVRALAHESRRPSTATSNQPRSPSTRAATRGCPPSGRLAT